MHPNPDWQIILGVALLLVSAMIRLLEWTAKPKKRKGRAATRPKQRKHG